MENPLEIPVEKDMKIKMTYTRNLMVYCNKYCNSRNYDSENQELGPGELNCLDRCTYKYFQVGEFVGKLYQEDKIRRATAENLLEKINF